jgi:hypothetical protein
LLTKEPKNIAEQAKYSYIPRRSSTRKGTPVFVYPSQQQQHFYGCGDRFYVISPGGYLYKIIGFICNAAPAELLEDENQSSDTSNEEETSPCNTNDKNSTKTEPKNDRHQGAGKQK